MAVRQRRFGTAFGKIFLCALLALACTGLSKAQENSRKDQVAFDTVSIRRYIPDGPTYSSGPCRLLPARVVCQSRISDLVMQAFGMQRFQISGPSWLKDDIFSIQATMPQDTSRSQALLMLQDALAERFGLVYHKERNQLSAFALVIGKEGTKLLSPANANPSDKNYKTATTTSGSQVRASALISPGEFFAMAITLDELSAWYLNVALDAPVVNMTGLSGKYKIDLHWTPTPEYSDAVRDPQFLSAVKSDLGLRLEKRTLPFEVLVVDHVNRQPAEN